VQPDCRQQHSVSVLAPGQDWIDLPSEITNLSSMAAAGLQLNPRRDALALCLEADDRFTQLREACRIALRRSIRPSFWSRMVHARQCGLEQAAGLEDNPTIYTIWDEARASPERR
jgi:hypothetical protein